MRAALALALALAPLAAGCPPSSSPCVLDEPAYGGEGNDEVWVTLLDAKDNATTGGDAPTVTAPVADAKLPAASAPTFEWESPLKIALGPTMPQPLFRRAAPSLLDVVTSVVIPSAHAHLPPVSSDAYLLEVFVPERECPVSVVTTELSHTLDATSWATIQEGAGPYTLQLTSAYLASGRVSEGPFKAADVTFTIE